MNVFRRGTGEWLKIMIFASGGVGLPCCAFSDDNGGEWTRGKGMHRMDYAVAFVLALLLSFSLSRERVSALGCMTIA